MHQVHDDVEQLICDLGRFGSGRPRPLVVACNLAGLRVLQTRAASDVTIPPVTAPLGLSTPPSTKLPEALCVEIATVVASELEHARC